MKAIIFWVLLILFPRALDFAGISLMSYGKQYLTIRCFRFIRALEPKTFNPSFHSLSISMATATSKDSMWKRVDLNPLEQKQTW